MVLVSIENFEQETIFEQDVDASIKISELRARVAPGQNIRLHVKGTDQRLEDEDSLQDSLPSLASQIVLRKVVRWQAFPGEEDPPSPAHQFPGAGGSGETIWSGTLRVGEQLGGDDEYTIERVLGEGSQAQVLACTRRDGERFAVKALRKLHILRQNDAEGVEVEETRDYINFRRELECLRKLRRHPCIVSLVDKLETPHHFVLMMELGQEDLDSYVSGVGALREPEARHVFLQLLDGLSFMHSQRYMQRDLKLDNIIVYGVERNPEGWNDISVKIGDFGYCKQVGFGAFLGSAAGLQKSAAAPPPPTSLVRAASDQPEASPSIVLPPRGRTDGERPVEVGPMLQLTRATSTVGTPIYEAPEVAEVEERDGRGFYGKEVDYFSLGVCLLAMLTGKPGLMQFADSQFTLSYSDAGGRGEYDLSFCEEFTRLTASVQTLIGGLVRVDTSCRFTLADCCDSDWLGQSPPEMLARVRLCESAHAEPFFLEPHRSDRVRSRRSTSAPPFFLEQHPR